MVMCWVTAPSVWVQNTQSARHPSDLEISLPGKGNTRENISSLPTLWMEKWKDSLKFVTTNLLSFWFGFAFMLPVSSEDPGVCYPGAPDWDTHSSRMMVTSTSALSFPLKIPSKGDSLHQNSPETLKSKWPDWESVQTAAAELELQIFY